MDNKLFLLLIAFISIVLASAIPAYYEGTTTLSKKAKPFIDYGEEVDSSHSDEQEKHELDDELPASSFGRRNRNFGYGSMLKGSKPRSRFVSVHDDDDENPADWFKPPAFGLDLSSIIPGFQLNAPAVHSESPQTCQSIVDPRFPLFSDLCGILPQSRYSLPNFFGHVEKWQIAQSLTTIFGPSLASQLSDPGCTRSLRLLVCPLLFPPCKPKRDILSVLPCQSFCQGVKAACPMPGIEHLPCEFLAPVSDVCPVNPLPYSSLLSSFASPFPLAGAQLPTPIPPVPFPSVFGQSPLSSPIAKPNLLTPQPFASPLQASTLLGQSPFSTPMTTSSLLNQSPFTSSAQSPSIQSLLQLQGNNFPATGLQNNAFSSFLQGAGIYSTPNIQSQLTQSQNQQLLSNQWLQAQQTQTPPQPLSNQWSQPQQTQTQQQPLSNQWSQPQQTQTQQQPLSNQWSQSQQTQTQQQPLLNQWSSSQQTHDHQQPLSNHWVQPPQPVIQSTIFQQQQQPIQQQQTFQQSSQQPIQQQLPQQPQQLLQQQFLQQSQQPQQTQLFQQTPQQAIQPQFLQQQSQVKPQYLQQLPNTLVKTIDTNKLTPNVLPSGFIDLPEIGPLADISKPNAARIFPALRSSNEKL